MTIENYFGNEIPWDVAQRHMWASDEALAEEAWDKADGDPQKCFDAFCEAYSGTSGEAWWLDQPNPIF